MGRLGKARAVWLMSIQYNDIRSLITRSLLQAKQTSLTSTSPHENRGGLKVTLHWHFQVCQHLEQMLITAFHSLFVSHIQEIQHHHVMSSAMADLWYMVYLVKNGKYTLAIIVLSTQIHPADGSLAVSVCHGHTCSRVQRWLPQVHCTSVHFSCCCLSPYSISTWTLNLWSDGSNIY